MSNMKKSQIKINEILKDIDKAFSILSKIENTDDIEKIDFNSIKKEIDILSKKVTKKYPKDLDSKK